MAAYRPIERREYEWVHPDEKEDPQAMRWTIKPLLFRDSLVEQFHRTQNRNFSVFFNDSVVQNIVKVTIPNGKSEKVHTDPKEIDDIISRMPVQYGQMLQIAIMGEGDILQKGELAKN